MTTYPTLIANVPPTHIVSATKPLPTNNQSKTPVFAFQNKQFVPKKSTTNIKGFKAFLTIFFATFLSPPPTKSTLSLSHSKLTFFACILSPISLLSFIPNKKHLHRTLPETASSPQIKMARRLFSCFGKSSSASSSSSLARKTGTNVAVDVSHEEQRRGGAILVELFSSQGCATSPEAELLVSRLGRGDFELETPVIVLAYHVDYWDYMGWKDPFGSSQWTVRQKAYVEALNLDTMFTPQVVVQGRVQCIGNDQDALLSSIAGAPRFPAPTFQATFQRPSADTLQVSLTGALRNKVDSNGANIMVALYENSLVTDCPKGENKGRILSNDFVVRKLEKLCAVKDMSAKKTVTGTVKFSLWEGFNGSKCGVVVFVQSSTYQIFASQNYQLPDNL